MTVLDGGSSLVRHDRSLHRALSHRSIGGGGGDGDPGRRAGANAGRHERAKDRAHLSCPWALASSSPRPWPTSVPSRSPSPTARCAPGALLATRPMSPTPAMIRSSSPPMPRPPSPSASMRSRQRLGCRATPGRMRLPVPSALPLVGIPLPMLLRGSRGAQDRHGRLHLCRDGLGLRHRTGVHRRTTTRLGRRYACIGLRLARDQDALHLGSCPSFDGISRGEVAALSQRAACACKGR